MWLSIGIVTAIMLLCEKIKHKVFRLTLILLEVIPVFMIVQNIVQHWYWKRMSLDGYTSKSLSKILAICRNLENWINIICGVIVSCANDYYVYASIYHSNKNKH